jgi:hypothetical protein
MLFCFLAWPSVGLAAPADPDVTFDGDGVVTVPSAWHPIAASSTPSGGYISFAVDDSLHARIDAWTHSGDVDPAFAGGAPVILSDVRNAKTAAIDFAGRALLVDQDISGGIRVQRFLPNGDLDLDYGNAGSGVVGPALAGSGSAAFSMAVAADGSVFSVGWTQIPAGGYRLSAWKLDAAGHADVAFGINGSLDLGPYFFVPPSITVDVEGRPLVVASSDINGQLSAMRLESDGSLDESFGLAGRALLPVPNAAPNTKMIALAGGGYLVAAATYSFSGVALIRLDDQGALEPEFGVGGRVNLGNGAGYGAMGLAASGETLYVGSVTYGGSSGKYAQVVSAYHLGTGLRDPSFNVVTYSSNQAGYGSVELGADHKVLFNESTGGFAGIDEIHLRRFAGADETKPTIRIDRPVDGAILMRGDLATFEFNCEDDFGGSGLDSCLGTYPSGTLVDTSVTGSFVMTVTSADRAGNKSFAAVNYTVIDDTLSPTVEVDAPADGAVFDAGQVVPARFSCSDEPGGSGLENCVGTVGFDQPIDTASIGDHVFTATATDRAGNVTSVSHSYTIVPIDVTAPSVSIVSPPSGGVWPQGQSLIADYSCADEAGGSGIASCIGTVPSGAALDTSQIGPIYFTVIAVDNAGNVGTAVFVLGVYGIGPNHISIGLTSPSSLLTYTRGERVLADYSCTSDSGAPIIQCDSTLPTGVPIDTSTAGTFRFSVTARDAIGNQRTNVYFYTVVHASSHALVSCYRWSAKAMAGPSSICMNR